MTLRSHIYVVKFLLLTLLTFTGCASVRGGGSDTTLKGDLKTEALDVAGRGSPDTWRWIQPATGELPEMVVREEMDLNLDGKWDFRKNYTGGVLVENIIDLDFDGRPDVTEFYEEGALSRVESAHTFSGKTDTWKFYEKGSLARVERDTNRDGKPDEWLYYAQGRLDRLGKDLNFDGVVDTWK